MRKQIAAANWKMNLSLEEGLRLAEHLVTSAPALQPDQLVVLAVPFPYLQQVKEKISGTKSFFIAAQNCYFQEAGAYTGEVSVGMLASVGTDYVLIGHSERREYFSENHQMLAEKVNRSLAHGLKPIFCCGEPLSVREAGEQNSYVETQLKESLFHLEEQSLAEIVIAYEPIWAIGTGRTATSEQAQEMHAHIRKVLETQYGKPVAENVSILYGGSVKAANAKEIFGQQDVDGGLVGGASLVGDEFVKIIEGLK